MNIQRTKNTWHMNTQIRRPDGASERVRRRLRAQTKAEAEVESRQLRASLEKEGA